MQEEKKVQKIFEDNNVFLKDGHFKLESGFHSDVYIQVRLALSIDSIAKQFSEMMANHYKSEDINKVLGFSVGGNKLAIWIADHLNSDAIIAEKKGNSIVIPPHSTIKRGDKVLIVEDVLTTNQAIIPVISALKKLINVQIVGLGVIVDRRQDDNDLGVKTISLCKKKYNLWPSESCPLCEKGIPIQDFSSPNLDSFSIVYSLSPEDRTSMIRSYLDFFKRIGEDGLYEEIESTLHPPHEIPGKKFERVVVLGSFDNFGDIDRIAKIVSSHGYYAITSKLIYQKNSGRRFEWKPYPFESMNDFLARMIFSCQYSIIVYNREGGQFIETMWCSQNNKPTLGIVYLRPWEMDHVDKKCEYLKNKNNYLFCNGFEALKLGSELIGGFICVSNKDCPFPSSKLTKMILDLYTTSQTMGIIGTDSSDNISNVIQDFLTSHGNIEVK